MMIDEQLFVYNENGSRCPLSTATLPNGWLLECVVKLRTRGRGSLEIEVSPSPSENRVGEEFYRTGGTLVLHFAARDEPE